MIIEFGYSQVADKFFMKLEKIRATFESNIMAIGKGNSIIDIKLLKGYKDLLRMRIGDYRIVYSFSNGEVLVIIVLPVDIRGSIYQS